ncbi:aminotransferase class V-fold PLP-dependent enzyme [Candidatus Micrarchaeota archaeon]|nr:aminotransferase class V-fold PLP-dependent enzyme [Candidatus Micrarchaeota archaeon]
MQNAQKIFFTPGPSQLLPAVELEIPNAVKNGVCSISHRGKEFKEIFSNTKAQLSKLLGIPSGHKIFFLSSATEGMERIVQNTVGKNSFHFVNGGFSKKFLEVSDEL